MIPQIKIDYLSVACSQFLALFHCSVFKVQTSNLFQGQIEMFTLLRKHFNPILDGGDNRDRTDGLLLARQALSQLSYTPRYAVLSGGPKWTRTTDLTIISRAL